jgi:hypothetical protein
MPDVPAERTTLRLIHIRGDLYGVDFTMSSAYSGDQAQQQDVFRFDDIADSLSDLGWEIEADESENGCRRLTLIRERVASEA